MDIASDDVIRNEWSRGEIKKPETINYRTLNLKKAVYFAKNLWSYPRLGVRLRQI